jgi:hypothetical protein
MLRPKALKSNLITKVEEDKVYVLKAKNKHGQIFTIDIYTTAAEAKQGEEDFRRTRATNSYWKQANGDMEIDIEVKPARGVSEV